MPLWASPGRGTWSGVGGQARVRALHFPGKCVGEPQVRPLGIVDACHDLIVLGFRVWVQVRSSYLKTLSFSILVKDTIHTVTCGLTQKALDIFCRTYNIHDSLEPELPGPEDTIMDSPAGKIVTVGFPLKNASVVPISVPWFDGVSVDKDPAPSNDTVDLELMEVLDKNCALFRKYPETFLGVVGLSRVYDDEDTRPTFLDSNYKEMGLFEFINTFDSFKVKIGERTLAEGEVFLLKETEDQLIPPSDEIITVVDHNITDELKDAATGNGKKRVAFDGAEPLVKKSKTAPFAAPSEKKKTASTTGKTLAALKKIVTLDTIQDTSGSDPATTFVPSPTPEYLDESDSVQIGGFRMFPKQTKAVTVTTSPVHEAGTSSVALDDTSPVNDIYEYHTIDSAKAKNVYVPKWNITNDFELDDPWLCRNFVDHIPPPGYWASLQNLPSLDFLEQYNMSSDRQACMNFELRLSKVKGEDEVRREFMALQDVQAKCIEDHVAKLGERLNDLDIEFDTNFFPNMLKAVLGKRWVIGHGFPRDLKDVESYDVDARQKYIAAVQDLKDVPFPLLDSLEACKDSIINSRFPAVAASLASAAEKRKKDASLGAVAGVADASQPSSLAPSIELPVAETVATTNAMLAKSAASEARNIVLVQAADPTRLVPEVVTDSSARALVISQEQPLTVHDYHNSDFNARGDGVQNDNDMFDSSILDKVEDVPLHPFE
ncbi:hypothetical protein Tco_1115945 [Tanacetum coccineum]